MVPRTFCLYFMQARVDWILIIFETQVIKKKRPVRSAFPDYLSVSYDYGIANCFQTTWALLQLFKADYKYISIISINDWTADEEFSDFHLKLAQGIPVDEVWWGWSRKSYLGPAEMVSFSSRSFSHLNQIWFKCETPPLFFLIISYYVKRQWSAYVLQNKCS